jgi:phosphatidylinositol alpha-mannosyltransferase
VLIDLISYRLPVEGEKRGGIERVAHELSNGLARRGHQVTVWSYDPAPAHAAYAVRPLPWGAVARNPLGLRMLHGYLGNFVNCMPAYGGDVLIASGDSLLLPLRRRPLLRIMFGSGRGEALSTRRPWRVLSQWLIYLQELLTARTQPCVGISANTRRHNRWVKHVVPLGIDCRRFHPAPARKTPYPSILFVGALGGRKRGRQLLAWFHRQIRPLFPEARLIMVSRGGDALPGVEYRTGVAEDELVRLYQQAWVYASPSVYEGFGLPYLEAMACGTAVVASPNPGSSELLSPDFGVLARDEQFPAEIMRLFRDAHARAALEQRGLERARQYSLDAMLSAYEGLLLKTAQSRANAEGRRGKR